MFWWLKKYFVTFLLFIICSSPAIAKVLRLDETDLDGQHFKYLYQWYNPDSKPKAILLAIHGLTMHGSIYDGLARRLVEDGFLVLAPDLPGYGRCKNEPVSYTQAVDEIAQIVKSIKADYKDLPIIGMGESLGCDLSLYAMQTKSLPFDGLILANPALKPRFHLKPWMMKNELSMLISLLGPDPGINLSPYIKAYLTEDPSIAAAVLADPLVRKQLSYHDIWHSYTTMWPIYKKAGLINNSVPILIMQGRKDKVLESKAIIKLVSSLHTTDLTVKWFKNHGHLMLETPQPYSDILETVDQWVNAHIDKPLLQASTAK